MEHLITELSVGASAPFTLLQMTDAHLIHADERDGERLLAYTEKRRKTYPHGDEYLAEVTALARKLHVSLVNTGDLIDCQTAANLDLVARFTAENDVLNLLGNHDCRPYGGMEYDCPAVRAQTIGRIRPALGREIRFRSVVRNGVNLVLLDNAYYWVEPWQYGALRRELARGLPTLLFVHVPLFQPELHRWILETKGRLFSSLMGVPDELLATYPEKRLLQQRPTEFTRLACDLITHAPNVAAVIAGHTHLNWEGTLEGGVPQYITGAETARELRIS